MKTRITRDSYAKDWSFKARHSCTGPDRLWTEKNTRLWLNFMLTRVFMLTLWNCCVLCQLSILSHSFIRNKENVCGKRTFQWTCCESFSIKNCKFYAIMDQFYINDGHHSQLQLENQNHLVYSILHLIIPVYWYGILPPE